MSFKKRVVNNIWGAYLACIFVFGFVGMFAYQLDMAGVI